MKFLRLLIIVACVVILTGCTDEATEMNDIQPTIAAATRDPAREAELHEILAAAVMEAVMPKATMSQRELRALEEYENNKSEFIRLNLTADKISSGRAVYSCSEDLIMLRRNDRFGFINIYGEFIIPFDYTGAYTFSEGLIAVLASGGGNYKWGYIDKTGEVVIPMFYGYAGMFDGDYAIVYQEDKTGVIDKSGSITVPMGEYFDISRANHENLFIASDEAGFGVIDGHNNIIVPFEYNYIGSFNRGFAVFSRLDSVKRGIMNTRGEVIIPDIYEDFSWEAFGDADVAFASNDTRKYAIININGELVTDFIFDIGGMFSEGLARVEIRGENFRVTQHYVDETGDIIISGYQPTYNVFRNGTLIVTNANYGYGIIDRAGRIVLPLIYNIIYYLGDGLISAQRYENGTWEIYKIEEIG